ncbi:hypothetical protein GCM10011575_45430 [Microlunatus endophyticus]|uniref:Uncharacterized protein n=1 Tax=Microlunatus endophyticus TaxID=1716077 RepID=A0A917SJA2_9ACTN|nr:hypothetical protein [Microlunatus endophyticus]GGL82111.1 hypothetical protein GCM10011575_45430 [Microlunatus endophyticus]
MTLFDHFFDLTDPGAALTDTALTDTTLVNTVVVEDQQLATLDRRLDRETPVTVINSTGAGGIPALARRTVNSCRVAAVQSSLRDPGDLVGNIARIAAAARELDPGVTLLVGIPDGYGWQQAVEAAEAEELVAVAGRISDEGLATRLSAFVEADLGFVVDGVDTIADLVGLAAAVDLLIDGPEIEAATKLLGGADHDQQLQAIKDWPVDRAGRVRRRLRSVRTRDLAGITAGLTRSGLLT